MKKKKGFTLIELLAVILVLGIITLIAIPVVINIMKEAKKGALKSSAYGLSEAADLYYSANLFENVSTLEFICAANKCTNEENELSFKGKIETGRVKLFSDGKVSLCIQNDIYAAVKLSSEDEVILSSGTCNYTADDYTVDEYVTLIEYNRLKVDFDDYKSKVAIALTNNGLSTFITDNSDVVATNIDTLASDKYTSGYDAGFAAGKGSVVTHTVNWSCSYYDGASDASTKVGIWDGYIGTGKSNVYVGATSMNTAGRTDGSGSGYITSSYDSATGYVHVRFYSGTNWVYRTATANGFVVYTD